jgi:predicted DNA-binding transcriptional regulator AlpA
MSDESNYTLLTRKEAAEFLGLSVSSFDTARKKDNFPVSVVLLSSSKWMQCDLEDYIEASKQS